MYLNHANIHFSTEKFGVLEKLPKRLKIAYLELKVKELYLRLSIIVNELSTEKTKSH